MPTKKEKQPLSVTHPELAKEADGWDPSLITKGSAKKLNWKCEKGHRWANSPNSRSNNKGKSSGCPFCSGTQVLAGFNDLLTTHPELASEAFNWDPSKFSKGSEARVEWQCKNGHKWVASIGQRTNRGTGCRSCLKLPIVGVEDLLTTHPEIAAQADGWDPTKYSKGSQSKLKWKCLEGHTYHAQINTRTSGKLRRNLKGELIRYASGCPICSGKQVLKGTNDLASQYPEIAAEAYDWDPSTLVTGTDKARRFKCSEGHIYEAQVRNRTAGHNCPTCSPSGFDPLKPAWLYFITHSHWKMLQIGITNSLERRLNEHRLLGWEVIEYRGPMDGHLTKQWETAMLRMLKANGADLSNPKIAGKFDGYSEAWSKSAFDVKSIKDLMRLTEEFEEK